MVRYLQGRRENTALNLRRIDVKGQRGKHKIQVQDEFVQVDAYLIPKGQADMYRVLREAVAQDLIDFLTPQYDKVSRVNDNPEEGEAIVAYQGDGQEAVRIYLSPQNISQAQKARDKDHIDKFVENFL